MVLFNTSKSPSEVKSTLKKVLENQHTEIDNLKKDIKIVKDEQLKLKEKYEFVLETLLEKIGKGSDRFPIENSKQSESHIFNPKPIVQIRELQLLMLLENSKATNRSFAVSVNQLITAFAIEVSDRTLRNKLSSLEMRGLVSSFGNRPKYFFLTPSGVNLLHKQKRGVLSFEPI